MKKDFIMTLLLIAGALMAISGLIDPNNLFEVDSYPVVEMSGATG